MEGKHDTTGYIANAFVCIYELAEEWGSGGRVNTHSHPHSSEISSGGQLYVRRALGGRQCVAWVI